MHLAILKDRVISQITAFSFGTQGLNRQNHGQSGSTGLHFYEHLATQALSNFWNQRLEQTKPWPVRYSTDLHFHEHLATQGLSNKSSRCFFFGTKDLNRQNHGQSGSTGLYFHEHLATQGLSNKSNSCFIACMKS